MLGVTEQNVKTPSRMRPWGPILQRRRGTAANRSPTRPRPRETTWGALGPGRSAHPRGSSVASRGSAFSLQVARQLQPSVVWIGDTEKTFYKKVPSAERTVRAPLPPLGAAFSLLVGAGWGEGGGTATSLHPKCLSVFKRIQWAAFMGHNSENERVWKWGRELESQTRDSRELCGEQQRARSALLLGLPPVRNSNTEGLPRGARRSAGLQDTPLGPRGALFQLLPSFFSFLSMPPLPPISPHKSPANFPQVKKKNCRYT